MEPVGALSQNSHTIILPQRLTQIYGVVKETPPLVRLIANGVEMRRVEGSGTFKKSTYLIVCTFSFLV